MAFNLVFMDNLTFDSNEVNKYESKNENKNECVLGSLKIPLWPNCI